MTLLLDLGLVLLGTVLLIFAAKYLLEGLIGVSAAFAVPTFILAMLVISIDLEVFAPAVVGSYQDFTALSYGSILGTVVFLIGLALGTAAAIYPITRVDFPPRYVVLLGAALVANLLFAFDGTIQTWEGLLSIALYVAYLIYLIVDLGRTRAAPTEITEAEAEVAECVASHCRCISCGLAQACWHWSAGGSSWYRGSVGYSKYGASPKQSWG